jgi:hypothetical protein
MYQDPSGGNWLAPQTPSPPQRLINASWLMCACAAIQVIVLIIELATIGNLKSVDRYLTSSQFNAAVGKDVLLDLLVIGLWVWMAWANRRGRPWARIVATVLFGLHALLLIKFVRQPPHLNFNLVVEVLI